MLLCLSSIIVNKIWVVAKSFLRSQLLIKSAGLISRVALIGGFFGPFPLASGQGLTVTSSTDGNGLYTYTFSKGTQPFVWGLSTNTAIYLQSYGVIETSQPTNWVANFDPFGRIVWNVPNGIDYIDDPVTVTVRSVFKISRTYSSWGEDEPSVFRRGFVLGYAYGLPNHDLIGPGIENFVSIGPDPTALTIQRSGQSVVVSWYSGLTNSQLEATTSLSSPNLWASVTNAPVTAGDRIFVTNSISTSSRYYRLKF
jgi:hypothetical protein